MVATAAAGRPRERRPPLTPRAGFRRSCAIVVFAGRDGCAHLHFPFPFGELAAQLRLRDAIGPVRQRPTEMIGARPPGRITGKDGEGTPLPCIDLRDGRIEINDYPPEAGIGEGARALALARRSAGPGSGERPRTA